MDNNPRTGKKTNNDDMYSSDNKYTYRSIHCYIDGTARYCLRAQRANLERTVKNNRRTWVGGGISKVIYTN